MSIVRDLARLKDIHGQLLDLAGVGLGLLKKDDWEAFEDPLAKRRKLFKELKALHQKLGPAFSTWDQTLQDLAPGQRGEARELEREIFRSANALKELDRQIMELLAKKRTDQAAILTRLSRGRKLRQAYRPLPKAGQGPSSLSRTG